MGEHFRLPKYELRRRLFAVRRQRSPEEIAAASREIGARVLRLVGFRQASHLVAYAARPDEVDPSAIVGSGLRAGKAVYFPKVTDSGLAFIASSPADLRPGAFGVREPAGGRPLGRAAADVLFLVPGLTFDPTGGRLGRGGGHYDRALRDSPYGLRVGLAIDADLSPALPIDVWDQRMDAVVSERRLLWCAARAPTVLEENLE